VANPPKAISDPQGAYPEGERVVCIIARDVLPLDRKRSDFSALVAIAWNGRWLVLVFALVFGVLSATFALLATEWYEGEVVLTPAAPKNAQGLAAQFGGIGALAGLAGLTLAAPNTAEPIAVLKSREFARQFIEEQGLLHVLLADDWDAKAGRWKQSNPKRQPDIRDAIKYFDKRVLTVQEDKRTGLVTVHIEWKDAVVAANWANLVVDRLNEQMRSRALDEAQTNVDYLQKALAATNVVAVEQAISKLLETEMQKVMVARGTKEFAFRIIDPAQVPKFRSRPKRSLMVSIGLLVGGLAGLFAVYVRHAVTRRPPIMPLLGS